MNNDLTANESHITKVTSKQISVSFMKAYHRAYFFQDDKENTLLRHANKLVHQSF